MRNRVTSLMAPALLAAACALAQSAQTTNDPFPQPINATQDVVRVNFTQAGSRGFGRFYTYTDTTNTTPAPRADLRFGTGPDNQVFLLNKQDGVVRLLTR